MGGRRAEALAAGVALAAFANALRGDFVFDDFRCGPGGGPREETKPRPPPGPGLTGPDGRLRLRRAVVENPDVVKATPLADLFRNDFWGTPLASPASHQSYRPLAVLAFRAVFRLGGLRPEPFHAAVWAAYAVSCALFVRVCRRVVFADPAPGRLLLCGLLFALHPVHCEAVASVVGGAEVFASVFFFLSVLASPAAPGRDRGLDGLARCGAYAVVAMLFKEQGIMALPVGAAVRLLRAAAGGRRAEVVAGVKYAAAAAAVFLAVLACRVGLARHFPTWTRHENPAAFAPDGLRAWNHLYIYLFNLRLLILPATLSCDWGMGSIPLISRASEPRALASALALLLAAAVAALSLAAVCGRRPEGRRGKGKENLSCVLLAGVCFAVLPFLPSMNLLVVVGFAVAERVLFLPSAGLCIIAGTLLHRLAGRAPRHAKLPLVTFLLALLAARTVARNRAWRSAESLFGAAIAAAPRNEKVYAMLGDKHMKDGALDRAEGLFKAALALEPGDFKMHYSLGVLYQQRGALDASLAAFRGALATGPEFSATINGRVFAAHLHNKIGDVQSRMGRADAALESFDAAVAAAAGDAAQAAELVLGHANRGSVLGGLGRWGKAAGAHEAAYKVAGAHGLHGRALEALFAAIEALVAAGRHAAARERIEAVLRADPRNARARALEGRLLRLADG